MPGKLSHPRIASKARLEIPALAKLRSRSTGVTWTFNSRPSRSHDGLDGLAGGCASATASVGVGGAAGPSAVEGGEDVAGLEAGAVGGGVGPDES